MQTRGPILTHRPRPFRSPPKSRPDVVGEILSDGTVRPVGAQAHASATHGNHGWASGSLFTDGWMLWWERRSS